MSKDAANVRLEMSNVGKDAANVCLERSNVGKDAANVCLERCNVGKDAANVSKDAANVRLEKCNVGKDAANVSNDATNMSKTKVDGFQTNIDDGKDAIGGLGTVSPDIYWKKVLTCVTSKNCLARKQQDNRNLHAHNKKRMGQNKKPLG